MCVKLYMDTIIQESRLRLINAFGKGLNMYGISEVFKNELSKFYLEQWLAEGGRISACTFRNILLVDGSHGELGLGRKEVTMELVFLRWLESASQRDTDWIHHQIAGTSKSTGERLHLGFFHDSANPVLFEFYTCAYNFKINIAFLDHNIAGSDNHRRAFLEAVEMF